MGRRYLHLRVEASERFSNKGGELLNRREEGDFCSTDCQMMYLRKHDFTLGDAPDG